MIAPSEFFFALKQQGIHFFTGVPDSLLKSFCAYLEAHASPEEHLITANEGNAVALAAGYYLATAKPALVYMQNSGLGNAFNPLVSLTDPKVYSIPMLLMLGWRGEPGIQDEPQHLKQGEITPEQLQTLGIPYAVLEATSDWHAVLMEAVTTLIKINAPVALLIKKGVFQEDESRDASALLQALFFREQALNQILSLCSPEDIVLSTTGKTSRELFELRLQRNEPLRDFLTVGSMGHLSSIALGLALYRPDRRVICLDGDGALLMHMGAMAVIGEHQPPNLVHVLLNNAAHESVGGQPTVAGRMDFNAIAKGCGYPFYYQAQDHKSLVDCWTQIESRRTLCLLEILIAKGSRKNLGRPTQTPAQTKEAFMSHVRSND